MAIQSVCIYGSEKLVCSYLYKEVILYGDLIFKQNFQKILFI